MEFLPISYYQLFVPISVYGKQLNCLDDGGIQGKAKIKVCPADVPCMYELKHDVRHATKGPMRMCGTEKIPGVAIDKTVCHTSQYGSHIQCYCMTDNCNQNCTLPKDLGSTCIGSVCIGVNTYKCTDLGSFCVGSFCLGVNSDLNLGLGVNEPKFAPHFFSLGINDPAAQLCAAKQCSCDASTCMARATDDQNNPMTMKTRTPDDKNKTMAMKSTKQDDKDKTKTLKSTTTTKKTGADNDTPTSKNMLTSKSSTTIATAFHVVIGMVIIIKHFALLMTVHLITAPNV